MSHPSRAVLDRFFSGTRDEHGDPAVARHLLPECAVCSEVIADWASTDPCDAYASDFAPVSMSEAARYEEVVSRVLGKVAHLETTAATERRAASRLLPRLLGQPLERQLILVGNSRQYRTAAICELLLEASFAQRSEDPAASAEIAQVAIMVASHLDAERYGGALVHDYQGRGWAHFANARRILGDFAGADQALAAARSLLAEGTGSLLDEAFCSEVETSLRSARGDQLAAVRCASRSIELYRQIGDRHRLGRVLIQQGMVWGYADDLVREVVLVRTGLQLVDLERDSRLALVAWHNLCWALHQVGENRQALAALGRARPAYLQFGDRTGLIRFQWLEGTIAASLHRDEQAEGCLREARDGFIQLGIATDAALVSLDLAGLLCREGRTAEVRRLALEMITIFESREIRREALAAFILLRQAAERDRVTEALLKQLTKRLREPQARG